MITWQALAVTSGGASVLKAGLRAAPTCTRTHTNKQCYEYTEVIKVFTLTNNYFPITDTKQVNIFFFSLFCFTLKWISLSFVQIKEDISRWHHEDSEVILTIWKSICHRKKFHWKRKNTVLSLCLDILSFDVFSMWIFRPVFFQLQSREVVCRYWNLTLYSSPQTPPLRAKTVTEIWTCKNTDSMKKKSKKDRHEEKIVIKKH